MLVNLLETSSAVVSCCLAITAMSNQLTTCKQLIGKEGNIIFRVVVTPRNMLHYHRRDSMFS